MPFRFGDGGLRRFLRGRGPLLMTTLPPLGLGLRGEGRRLADRRLQGRQPRLARQTHKRRRSHAPLSRHRGGRREGLGPHAGPGRRSAIYYEQLRSRFAWLREPNPDAVATPPPFMAFDLLYRDGRDLSARPLRDRRARLEDVVAGQRAGVPGAAAGVGRAGGVAPGGRARPTRATSPRTRPPCTRAGRRSGL